MIVLGDESLNDAAAQPTIKLQIGSNNVICNIRGD